MKILKIIITALCLLFIQNALHSQYFAKSSLLKVSYQDCSFYFDLGYDFLQLSEYDQIEVFAIQPNQCKSGFYNGSGLILRIRDKRFYPRYFKIDGKFKNGKLEGLATIYSYEPNKYLSHEEATKASGYKKNWHGNYKNGLADGKLTYYYEGKLSRVYSYETGVKNGAYKQYYMGTNELHTTGNYKNGELDGHYVVFNEDGSVKETRLFKNGKWIKHKNQSEQSNCKARIYKSYDYTSGKTTFYNIRLEIDKDGLNSVFNFIASSSYGEDLGLIGTSTMLGGYEDITYIGRLEDKEMLSVIKDYIYSNRKYLKTLNKTNSKGCDNLSWSN